MIPLALFSSYLWILILDLDYPGPNSNKAEQKEVLFMLHSYKVVSDSA